MLRSIALPVAAAITSVLAWQPAVHAVPVDLTPPRAGQVAGVDPQLSRYFTQPVKWSSTLCPKGQAAQTPMQCARLVAPRDWKDPSKGELRIGISRAAGSEAVPRRGRLLLANPGGPGGEGLAYALQVAKAYRLTGTHTAIGIDPRGLGLSTPVKCEFGDALQPGAGVRDSRRLTKVTALRLARQNAAQLKKCQKQHGGMLRYINSAQTAGDFVMVSKVLGYRSFDYFGTSYGTWLGSIIEKLYPQDVDRIVLDSNLDWAAGSMERGFAYQPQAFQAGFDKNLLPWYGRHHSVYRLGGRAAAVNATYERLRAAVGRGAVPGATPDTLDAVMTITLYNPQLWDPVGRLLRTVDRAVAGNKLARLKAAAVIKVITSWYSSGASATVFTAVSCGDTSWEQNPVTWYNSRSAQAKRYPLVGAGAVLSPCAGWNLGPALSKKELDRPVSGVLMLQNESDGPTSYKGALNTRRRALGQVRMVMVDDAPGHGVDSPCAARTAAAYLGRGKYPSRDVHCQSPLLRSGKVTDRRAYEFGKAASEANPLPEAFNYPRRDLREPVVDRGGPGKVTSWGQSQLATIPRGR